MSTAATVYSSEEYLCIDMSPMGPQKVVKSVEQAKSSTLPSWTAESVEQAKSPTLTTWTADSEDEAMSSTLPVLPPSIYRVPACQRVLNPVAYNPVVISIGPYHHDTNDQLRQMETYKLRYVKRLKRDFSENMLVKEVRSKLPELMCCYSEFTFTNEVEYVEMLVDKHCADRLACIYDRDLQLPGRSYNKERLVCLVRENIEEFIRSLVKDADVDVFSRLMVKGLENSAKSVVSKLVESPINSSAGDSKRPKSPVDGCIRDDMPINSTSSDNTEALLKSLGNGNADASVSDILTGIVKKFASNIVNHGLNKLARLLVRDGIFIILLLIKAFQVSKEKEEQKLQKVDQQRVDEYLQDDEIDIKLNKLVQSMCLLNNDPVFGSKAQENLWPYIKRDMLLVENQVPFLVVNILLSHLSSELHEEEVQRKWLQKHVLSLFGRAKIDANHDPRGQHILELYRSCRIREKDKNKVLINDNAKILFLKGVNIRQIEAGCFNDFKYIENRGFLQTGTLFIPKIDLTNSSQTVLQNLVAFEALHAETSNDVTFFVIFMARLLRKPLHVKIIDTWSKVQLSSIWTKQAITDGFQQLVRGIPGALPKKKIKKRSWVWPFTGNVLQWPSMFIRLLILLFIADSGKFIAIVALTFTVFSWWFSIFKILLQE